MPLDVSARRRQYFVRLIIGTVILAALAIPSLIHSAAAIGTLRNIPAEWLPDSLPLKKDFFRFIEKFGVTDVVLVSWPNARLGDSSVDDVVRLLGPLTAESLRREESEGDAGNVAQGDGTDRNHSEREWVDQFRKKIQQICADAAPLDWIRSGTEVRDRLTSTPLRLPERAAKLRLKGSLIGPDGRQTCLLISLGPSMLDHHRVVIPMIREAIAHTVGVPIRDVALVGGPVDGAAVDSESIRSIARYSAPASIVAALLCWICLRSIPLSLAIVGVATIGQGMVLAVVYYIGIDMNAILIVMPALVFVLTVSSGIHLSNYFLDLMRETPGEKSPTADDRTVAAAEAMRLGVPPCFLATFTTVVGLSSLCLVRLQPAQTFGLVASIGVASTLAMLILILPGTMVLTRTKAVAPPHRRERAATLERWAGAFLARPWSVLIIFLSIGSVTAIGLGRLTTSVSVPAMFLPESDLRQQYQWYETNVGATMTGELLLSFPLESGVDPISQVRDVMRVHAAVYQIDGVGGVLSALTFLPPLSSSGRMSSVANRSAIRRQISNDQSLIHSLGYLHRDEQADTWRITLRLFQTGDTDYGPQIDQIVTAANDVIQNGADGQPVDSAPSITMTGHVVVVQRTQQILLRDLFRSFLAAFVVIAIVMMVSLRSLRGGLLSMIPNLIPTVVLFGLMGWSGLSLDIGSIMTASVALGIAVDDTVHLLSRFRAFRSAGRTRSEAARRALMQCGQAMFQTTVVCSTSMMAYSFSEFIPTRRFAFFMFGLLAIAWLGVSILMPAMMSTKLGDYLAPQPSAAPMNDETS
jgi:predicted RND superfamily exporter protein